MVCRRLPWREKRQMMAMPAVMADCRYECAWLHSINAPPHELKDS